MKAKIVQYPYNHKRFEWDTFTLNKKFEYSWNKKLVANYSTMAPYIKTEQQDPASYTDYAYIDLAHDSANQPDWEAYDAAFTSKAVNPYYPNDIPKTFCGSDGTGSYWGDVQFYDAVGGERYASLQPGTPGDYISMSNMNKQYHTFTYWRINADNCNEYYLTENQFNQMVDNGFDLSKFLNYYTKHYNEDNPYDRIQLPSPYDIEGYGITGTNFKHLDNINIGKLDNQNNFTNEKDYNFTYEIVTNDLGAKTIEIKYTVVQDVQADLTFTYNSLNVEGVPYWEQKTFTVEDAYLLQRHTPMQGWPDHGGVYVPRPEEYAVVSISMRDNIYWGGASRSCLMYQMYRYNFTGFVCKRSENGPHKVYGVSGSTYNEPALRTPTSSSEFTEECHIFGVNNGADCTLIGTFTDTDGVEFNKIIFENPNNYLSDFIATVQYSSTWGISRTTHTENCMAVMTSETLNDSWPSLRPLLMDNRDFLVYQNRMWLFIPIENQQYDATEENSFAITIGDRWPSTTAWGVNAHLGGTSYYLNTTQPSDFISTFPYLVRKSDWPDYTGYYTPQAWEMNGAMVVRPEIRLLGDQTAANININITTNPAYSYVIGDYANNIFTPKTIKKYIPGTYKPIVSPGGEVWNYKWKVSVNGYGEQITELCGVSLQGQAVIWVPTVSHEYIIPILNQVTPAPTIEDNEYYIFDANTTYDFHTEANLEQFTLYICDNQYNVTSSNWRDCWDTGILDEFEYQGETRQIPFPFEKVMDTVPVVVDYEPDGYSWLTYNSYTKNEWANGYHLIGDNWNGLNSPYGYVNGIHEANGNRQVYLYYEDCPNGTYANLLTLLGAYDGTITDTVGNTLSSSMSVFNAALGPVVNTADLIVTSNTRNEYPDDGIVGGYAYKLKPELTKFIEYNEDVLTLYNVELKEDRYTYSHSDEYLNLDTSLYNTVIGTSSSTNEGSIPNAYVRTYKGIYYGQSIPFLGLVETVIDPGMILGVPIYNKQVNTSDTLKYGTVASASLTFRVDIPVDNAMVYNNKLLVAFYDFEHNGVWEPWGFFRIDTIEAQDENCTSIVAHDEVYKLNKYVDDFLKNYSGATTLDRFFKDLLDYCDCEYDPHMATINNGSLNLNNVYNATKTTGLEVAHYIANISPGFVHANMDNDIVLAQYKPTDKVKTISDYSNLVYNAYNTDMLNKVIITMNNAVIAEDQGSGTKTYYIADNPLLSKHISEAALVLLAEKVLQKYQQIPVYRPAQIKFLTSPGLDIGDVFTVVTKNSQQYNVATMEININESGLEIKSMGTATYPVDPSSNSQFVNLVDTIDTVQVDVDDLNDAVAGLDGRVGDIETDITSLDGRIDATESDISGLKGRMTTAEGNITSINGDISSLDSRVDDVEDGLLTVGNSLATKILADSISSANDLVTVKINGDTVSNIATKAYVDNSGGLGFTPAAFIAARVSITGNTSINAWYIGRYNADVNLWNGLLLPLEKYAGYNLFQATTNGVLWGLSASDGDWHIITNGSYSVRT